MRVGEETALTKQSKPEIIRQIVLWFADEYGLGVVGDILEALTDERLQKLWNDIKHIKTGTWDDVKGIRIYDAIQDAARAQAAKQSGLGTLLVVGGALMLGGKKKGRRR